MNLPGRVNAAALGDVLGPLYRAQATGVLELVEWSGAMAGRVHSIHWVRGLVAHVDSPLGGARLGELLRREGFLSPEGGRRLARKLVERPGRRTGEILITERLVDAEVVLAALRFQIRGKLDALFKLGDVKVRFHVAGAGGSVGRLPVPLSPVEFLQGRARARDLGAQPARSESPRQPRPEETKKRPDERPRLGGERARAIQVLGLPQSSDRAAVQRAFRKLASAVHPDRFPKASPTERAHLSQRFSELSAAYHVLVA